MKLPNKVMISGVCYTIRKDPKNYGGHFEAGKQIIIIGTKGKNDFQFLVLLHEIIEAILTERNYRYKLEDDEKGSYFLFSFNHPEYINIVRDIGVALKDIIK